MAFCPANTLTFDVNSSPATGNTYYMTSYVAPTGTISCLPNNGTGFTGSSVDSNGSVTTSAMSAWIGTLLSSAAAAPTVSDMKANSLIPADTFKTKSEALRNNIQAEYCYYYYPYQFALAKLLTAASTGATSTGATADSTYTTLKANTVILNSKLNQILQVLQALVVSRSTSLTGYQSDSALQTLDTDISTARSNLQWHSQALQNKNMESDVKSAMIDYTVEKNSSSRNLLAVYGFMNIVALGMLFYLYRAAKN